MIGAVTSGQITITTNIADGDTAVDSWSPNVVAKTGADLVWTATNSVIGDLTPLSVTDNVPVFDFSGNDGTDIVVTATSPDGYGGITVFDANSISIDKKIVDINILDAVNLEVLVLRRNRGLGTVDISTLTSLTDLNLQSTDITDIDLSNNDALTFVDLRGSDLLFPELDQIVIDLDDNNAINGDLFLARSEGSLTYNALDAYNSLEGKGWEIDVDAPPAQNTQTISFTTSFDGIWEPNIITNTGPTLIWSVSGGGVSIGDTVDNAPQLDLSGNTGLTTVTIRSEQGFIGFTEFDTNGSLTSDPTLGITGIDFSQATQLEFLRLRYEKLESISVSTNTALRTLNLKGNDLLTGVLDVSTNQDLEILVVEDSGVSGVSLINNPLLFEVFVNQAAFSSAALDQILLDLDTHPLYSPPGTFRINLIDQTTGQELTTASIAAYNSLKAKGWMIDPDPHPAASLPADINVQGGSPLVSIPGDGSNSPSLADNTDFGANFLINPITKTYTIQNLGDFDLSLTDPSPFVTITGTDAADFSVSRAPTTPIVGGGRTTFDITFDANATGSGTKTAIITIVSNDADEPSYTFNIQATANVALVGPAMQITGNGIVINNDDNPNLADGTDFGQVEIGSSVTREFTIQNIGDLELDEVFFSPSINPDIYEFVTPPIFPLPPGAITIMEISFSPTLIGASQDGVVTLTTNSGGAPSQFLLNLLGEGVATVNDAVIDVQGGTPLVSIPGDLSGIPSVMNDTDYGQVEIGSSKINTFTIFNNGTTDLDILGIQVVPVDGFSLVGTPFPATISPGASTTFDVDFSPVSNGSSTAIVQIANSDPNSPLYQYTVTGEGLDNILAGDIMITQYYNGSGGSNWIEVINISESTIATGTYFLALYNQGSDVNDAPDEFEPIPALAAGELVLFSNIGASLPLAGNLGVPLSEVIATNACNFTSGQDIILISTDVDASSYANREDIIGSEGGWSGTNISYIRGGNSNELPEIDFNIANWIPLSPSADVNVAVGTTNVMLGTQNVGSTSWDGSWDNSQPDRTRNASISGTYTALNGNIEAYNLVVESGTNLNFNNGTSNSVVVYGDLTISDSGNFIIGDQESLVMLNNSSSVSGNITKIENSASRNTDRDITYWSSSVTNATISTVFTGVTSSRIWGYDQSQTAESIPPDDPRDPTSTYWNVWQVASGLMVPGFGYAAEGLTGSSDVHTVSFTGVPNNGVIQFDVFEQADGNIDNDFNLIGNPYASAIDMDAFLELNGTINGVIFPEIYLWTHTNPLQPIYDTGVDFLPTDYAIRNIGGGVGVAPGADPLNNIGSGQGFMVRASESGGGLLQFTNPMRLVDENTQFFKQSNSKKKSNAVAVNETDRIWLNLTSDKQGFNQMLVVFTERASDDIDMGFDSRVFENGKPIMLYSNIEGSKYAIQGLGEFSEDKEIALGFDANVSNRVLTIGIDKLEGKLVDAKIYLVDNLLNVTHDLQKGDYTFDQAESGSFPDRFTLKFTRSNAGGNGNGNGKSMKVSNKFETLKIEATDPVRMIKVYDVFGRLIVVKEPNESTFDINIENVKPGTVLILESVLEDGSVLNKKAIRY